MGLSISASVRLQVKVRDSHRCVRCGVRGAEIHHRRGKRVIDEHTHCSCNLIFLCGWGNHQGCHGWVHSNPFEAKNFGLIVARHAIPAELPVVVRRRVVGLDCEGNYIEFDEVSRLTEE